MRSSTTLHPILHQKVPALSDSCQWRALIRSWIGLGAAGGATSCAADILRLRSRPRGACGCT
eukprot:239489-Rhodomonas_salina.1